ncbi:MAG: hypothetical protein GC162_10345 [Planctomycetes bacterium]|nr:hypothetical protein [Planctomycetota bacterium]
MPDLKRLGAISHLESEIERIETELKSLSESMGDKLLALRSHLDTDGKGVVFLANRYYELQRQGIEMRARLEELR